MTTEQLPVRSTTTTKVSGSSVFDWHPLDEPFHPSRFPKQCGVYKLVFEGDGRTLSYVGASLNIRQRIQSHLVSPDHNAPSWMRRLAAQLVEEWYVMASGANPSNHSEYWGMLRYIRCSTWACVLELVPSRAESEIKAAEDRWIAEIQPELNFPRRSGGYCFK